MPIDLFGLPKVFNFGMALPLSMNTVYQECDLLSDDEAMLVQEALRKYQQQYPDAVRDKSVKALMKGAAAHHAGCLPTWKAFIEELFQKGLLKVVFTTETLAAGINMPARCVYCNHHLKQSSSDPESGRLIPNIDSLLSWRIFPQVPSLVVIVDTLKEPLYPP